MSVMTTEPNEHRCDDWLIKYQRQLMMGSIAAMLAHEFNNLMTPVLTRAQFAQSNPTPEMLTKAVDATVRGTEKAVAICRRLMEVAQGDEPQVQHYSVRSAVDNALLALARPLDKDGITYSDEVADDLAVHADPILFEQVLINLLLNARSATRERKGSIRIAASQADNLAVIAISDTGTGIEPQRMQDVFQPFFAAEPSHQPEAWVHVGLGLHACRWICRQHEGRIEARNNEGAGCTFSLYWPLANGQ